MKIAIQANPNRGKEIISLLANLGRTKTSLSGDGQIYTYYIDNNNVIRYGDAPKDYKVYTLEEFEKEFPFKVGDKVIKKNDGKIGTIIKRYNPYMWGEMWTYDILYMVKFNDDPIPHRCSVEELKPYEKMKEERNITLTFNKAKEWYNKGGELKEIALQAFTEKELNPLPRSWEEFCKQYNPIASWRYTIPAKYEAFYKLEQLRDCWRQGWKLNWNDDQQTKYCVIHYRGKFKISMLYETRHFLSFPTKEMAEEFLKCFRDLIEKAGDLI